MKINKINTKNILEFENVDIDELTVEDEEKAVNMAGAEQGYNFMLAMLSIACTFDGKKYTMEELRGLKRTDFLELMQNLNSNAPIKSEETLSSSQDMQDSDCQMSKE